jgi:hypothetical protein
MRIITAALLLSVILGNTHAHAGHKEDCDRPEYAQQYAAAFRVELNGELDKFRSQETLYRAKLEGIKAALIQAGAWTEAEASVFMVKASMTDDDAKALEVERKKAASDFKVQLLSLDGIPIIVGGNKAAELRTTCILGPNAISKAGDLLAVLERAWKLLESKMAAAARAKNIPLP